jgi:hypothetical protein
MVKFKGGSTKKFHFSIFDYASEQGRIGFSANFQAGVPILIQVLIGLIQVKYQNTQASPFDTHGTTMSFFILVLVANVYAKYLLEITQPIPNTSYFSVTKLVCQVSGVVACGLLLSFVLPPFWWWIILFPCAFKSIRELHGSYQQISKSLHDIYQQISELFHDISTRVFKKLHSTFQWICNPTQQAGPPASNENTVKQKGESVTIHPQ